MYLRTPKRYQKPRRHVLSLRWLWLWILTPLVAVAGWQIYENRDQFAPPIQQFVDNLASSAQSGIATVTAPTPLPTRDPVEGLTLAANAWEQGAIDEAVRQYEDLLPNDPNNVQAYYRATLGMLIQGRDVEALQTAEKTVTANPFSSDAWAIRAMAMNANGRQGEAIASALQALNLNAQSARARAFLAEAYFDSNQIERALTTVEDALQRDPNSFEALYVYGRINNESLFDFTTAMDSFRSAYDIAPNMHYIGVEMAWLEMQEDNADGGFEILQQIAEMNPQNADALYALAWFSYSIYGDPNQALDYLTRCTTTNPRSIACNYYMGTVRFGMGDNEAAKDAFMRVIELGTTNPRHYLSAGRINAALNNCRAAIPLLQQGYELEQARRTPNTEQLIAFEEALRGCNAAFVPTFSNPTPEPAFEITPDAPIE